MRAPHKRITRLALLASLILMGLSSACALLGGSSPLTGGQDLRPVGSGVKPSVTAAPRLTPSLPTELQNKLLSLRMVPELVTLSGAKASQRVLVLGMFADQVERDLTSQSLFSISDPQLARIHKNGMVEALVDGETKLEATVGKLVLRTRIQIENSHLERPFDFARDIGGILTKRGCNSSDCHGSVKGKGGFKISLNMMSPQEDYRWITEGGAFQVLTAEAGGEKNPRINLKQPEKSLLLLKPTLALPHAGGKHFSRHSSDYRILLDWIRRGARFDQEGAESVTVERIEVFPRMVALLPDGKHRLLVTGYLSDGRTEDFTDKVHFSSRNPKVAKVSAEGLVEATGKGETVIMAQAVGHTASAGAGVIANPIPTYPEIPRKNFIDDYIFTKLEKLHILPSELASDAQFLRRVCLDITGTLPPPDRVREFLANRNPVKRDQLIEILLDSPEYIDYWTFRFSDLFRVQWRLLAPTYLYSQWLRESIAGNKPYDQMVRERVSAQGFNGPSRIYMRDYKAVPMERVVTEDVRVFMGRRLDCAQCHDHPFDTWSQDQFWGMAAFYGRMTTTELRVDRVLFEDRDGEEIDWGVESEKKVTFSKPVNPRTKQELPPTFMDGRVLAKEERNDPRKVLARWMTSHPYFAEAIVNRIWGHFFGRGIVDPVDNLSSSNPPTHPELLRALAKDFREHGHDLKHLMRLIAQSRTYQLSHEPNEKNRSNEHNYAKAPSRPLDGEVLLDAICQTTGIPAVFEGRGGTAPIGTRAIQLRTPEIWMSRFLEIYGRPFRNALPDRDHKPNLLQALHILVGTTYNDKLSEKGGRLAHLLDSGLSNKEIVEELYLATLARYPSEQEKAELIKRFGKRSSIVEHPFFKGSTIRREVLEDLLWALISSREFAYNH